MTTLPGGHWLPPQWPKTTRARKHQKHLCFFLPVLPPHGSERGAQCPFPWACPHVPSAHVGPQVPHLLLSLLQDFKPKRSVTLRSIFSTPQEGPQGHWRTRWQVGLCRSACPACRGHRCRHGWGGPPAPRLLPQTRGRDCRRSGARDLGQPARRHVPCSAWRAAHL